MLTRSHGKILALALGISSAVGLLATAPGLCEWMYRPQSPEINAKALGYFNKAKQCFKNGDYNTCLQYCEAAQRMEPGNKWIIHLEALAYSQNGDNYNAMIKFKSALTLDYNFEEARNNYGVFLKKTGNLEDARQQFEICIKVKPQFAPAHYNLGTVFREKADLDRAIQEFQTAVTLEPGYFDAQRDLGLTIYERYESGGGGDMKDSQEALQKAATLAPENPLIWYHLGLIDCSEGQLDAAETNFRNSLMKDPKVAASHYELGRLRYLRGDPDRCVSELLVAQKINPLFTEDHKYPKVDPERINMLLGQSYELKGLLEQAVDCYNAAAKLQHNNAPTLRHVAELIKQLKSKAHHKSKEKFDPEEVQALISKGISQTEDGELDNAKQTFNRALELNPNSFEATQNLGALLEASGDLNGAITKYQAAMALKPDFDGAVYNMAYVLEKSNLPSDAGAMYQKFHEMAGRYPYDPKHIVELQQEDVRARARQEMIKKRGY